MKSLKITILICGIAALLAFSACQDFLSPFNPKGVTEEMLYTTEDGFEAGVNACYSNLRRLWGLKQGQYWMEFGTDLWTNGSVTDNSTDLGLLSYQNLTGADEWLGNLWRQSYLAINQCNAMLGYVQYAKPQVRTAREAELLVLRSYYWWVLTEQFGDIHFMTRANTGAEIKGIKTAPDKVYEQIFKDLEFAVTESNLPSTSSDLGRITKPVAEALLARICLTRGRNAEAITYAKNVIDNYGYALETPANLWDATRQRSNKEAVWTLYRYTNNQMNGGVEFPSAMFVPQYSLLPTTVAKCGFMQGNYNDNDGRIQGGLIMPTYRLLDLYDQTSDARFAATFKNVWRANNNSTVTLMKNAAYPKWTAEEAAVYGAPLLSGQYRFNMGDTSLVLVFKNSSAKRFPYVRYTVLDETFLYDTLTKAPIERLVYFQLRKYVEPTQTTISAGSRDFFMIRLAEMYLIIAEADFKLNGSNCTVGIQALNDLRAKRALPAAVASFTNVTSIPGIDFILDERARELCGEQLRWFDLKRTGKLVDYVRAYNPDATIEDFHVLRPYPTAQIGQMSNPEDFVQEGYNP